MSNAFASIQQAPPCPAFGRPVHLWDSPLDYGPVLLLMPFGFHLTVDSLPSEELQTAAQLTPSLQIPVDFPRCSKRPPRDCQPLRDSQEPASAPDAKYWIYPEDKRAVAGERDQGFGFAGQATRRS